MNTFKKILLVEDDPLLIKMYQTKFRNEGFELIIAQDGEEGFKMADEQQPDFILLDIMMPKLSGIDLLAKLKENDKTKNIPVIVLTNLSQPKEAEKAIALGAKEYLIKADITPGEIVKKIKEYLK